LSPSHLPDASWPLSVFHHFLDGSSAWGWQGLAPLTGVVIPEGLDLFQSIILRHAALYAPNAIFFEKCFPRPRTRGKNRSSLFFWDSIFMVKSKSDTIFWLTWVV
jgi:hypothetical protein